MRSPEPRNDVKFTFEDYLKWDDGVRYELIDGVAYAIAAPNFDHQLIQGEIYGELRNFLKGKPCKAYSAPSDVKIDDHNVVQPDVYVTCDKSKLDGQFHNGVPDLIVEVLSPSNTFKEIARKNHFYFTAGVKEYWLVNPKKRIIDVFIAEDNDYLHTEYVEGDTIQCKVLDGFSIKVSDIFAEMLT